MTDKIKRQINKTKTRLRPMLQCQSSFGPVVGASILFFLDGFVFAQVQSLKSLGDEGTAIRLDAPRNARILLLGVPFLLTFPTAFFTPEDGLSCRSLTFVVFASVEYTQIALWLWAYAGPPPATPAQAAPPLLSMLGRTPTLPNPATDDPL